ncbi:MAG TPA: 50S ribosomal protein L13 [Thermoanaerobacterales bacterium]|nr:50S ribosomal protein L13 [Thermoanaerobacterales bacterium]
MKTFMAKAEEIERKWYIIDASNRPLGRLATEAATILRGKHKPIFTPHVDTGDFVIVVNAEKVLLTGNKVKQKKFAYHTGYPGGLKEVSYETMLEKNPERAVMLAVRRMLPKNTLGRKMFKKLKVYRGSTHPHEAQQPELWENQK